jgi:medium-chain acyl-[acyl-carrier-protein] hydrolase
MSTWWVIPQSRPQAALRLVCLPYAGGGATIYHRWGMALPEEIEVVALELPGRGRRIAEPLLTRIDTIIEAVMAELLPLCDRPVALFGHSMGALLGYELAQALRERSDVRLAHLFVSAHRAPHLPNPHPPMYNLGPADFRRRLEDLNGTPREVFEHPELYALVEPIIRADLEICNTYRWPAHPPLAVPITVYGGAQDRSVERSQLEAWRAATLRRCEVHLFAGDHFYLAPQRQVLTERISRQLSAALAAGPPGNP